jgi:hypothetical protein
MRAAGSFQVVQAVISCFRARVIAPVDAALAVGGPHSPEYRKGVLDAYAFRVLRTPIPPMRYQAGSAQADAYLAGVAAGHLLWRWEETEKASAAATSTINNQEKS